LIFGDIDFIFIQVVCISTNLINFAILNIFSNLEEINIADRKTGIKTIEFWLTLQLRKIAGRKHYDF